MKQARIIFQVIMLFDIRLYIQLLINPVSGLIESGAACYSTTSRCLSPVILRLRCFLGEIFRSGL